MLNEEKYKEARRLLCLYLKDLAKEKGISNQQIADKTGFQQSNVNRMLNGRYSPSLDNFLRLAEALDTHFTIQEG